MLLGIFMDLKSTVVEDFLTANRQQTPCYFLHVEFTIEEGEKVAFLSLVDYLTLYAATNIQFPSYF